VYSAACTSASRYYLFQLARLLKGREKKKKKGREERSRSEYTSETHGRLLKKETLII